ncbi:MAG: UDP-3-O-acylglucosamine N-acyltransferase [Saprospiraceae bacterium]|nr:MAG: UDP-3-O-acylglucosamine N-acyltransferase [Saprospiraceae bacterium]
MQLSARELAAILGGTVEGNPEIKINRPSKIEEGGEGSISFLGNPRYEAYAYQTTASILLVNRQFQPRQEINATLIRVDDVYAAIAILLQHFGAPEKPEGVIAKEAAIHDSVSVGERTSVGRFSTLEEGVAIGSDSVIADQVYVGKGVQIGCNVFIHPGVKILKDCRIGDNCVLHANVVIGGDGFGFAPQADGTYQKIAHVGNVIIEADVEIGANTTIDRGTMGSTIIRSGVKIDNLVQIAHNVEIGKNTVIAAQTGVAGSTKIGQSCRIGGQVGFAGHLTIADGTEIQAQSGLASSVQSPNTQLFGTPAIGYKEYIRSYAVFKKLPDLYKRLFQLEKKINQGLNGNE